MATGKAASISRRSASKSSSSASSKGSSGGSSNVNSLANQLSALSGQAKALGIDTRKADAMVSQTNREGSKSFAGSDEERAYNASVITPAALQNVPTLKVPPPIIPTGTPDIGALNAALANPETGLKTDTVGGFTVDAITENSIASQQKSFLDYYKAKQENALPDIIGIQKKLDKQTGIDKLKAQEAEFSGQLNSIVANRDAQNIALEGQGRGQTTSFIGGEQGRINREAAISALPVQAQLAAVQGKIQVANDYINKWGTLLVQDATNRYNQKSALIDATYTFANDIEKQRLTSLQTQAKEKKDRDIALANAKTKAMAQALSQPGGSAVISAIQSATDENGVVAALGQFNGDVLGNQVKQAQLRELNAPKGVAKRDTQVVEGKLIDLQTGEVISDFSGTGSPDAAQKGLDQVRFLRGTITDANQLVGATGPNAITRGLGNIFVGNTQVKQLQNKIDTLKTNLLTLNSDPNLKKFFGPQMTEKDTELLMSAGSTLDAYSNSVQDNKDELQRYDDLLKKIEASLSGQSAVFGLPENIVTAPDGMQYVFTD